MEEGGGGPEAAGNGASKSVAGEAGDAEGGNVAQVHPQDGAAEVARGEPDGAVETVGCGIGELEPRDRAEGEGYELSVQWATDGSGCQRKQEQDDKAREGDEEEESSIVPPR